MTSTTDHDASGFDAGRADAAKPETCLQPGCCTCSLPHCPVCGYTAHDAAHLMDHHLCDGTIPDDPATAKHGAGEEDAAVVRELAEVGFRAWGGIGLAKLYRDDPDIFGEAETMWLRTARAMLEFMVRRGIAVPDPIPQAEGDAPPAPAQSAGAAADGEDDAVFVERMAPVSVCPEEFAREYGRLVSLARRGARPLYAVPPSAADAPPAPASREDDVASIIEAAERLGKHTGQRFVPDPRKIDEYRRATSAPAQDAGPAGVTGAALRDQDWEEDVRALEAAARARTSDAGKLDKSHPSTPGHISDD